MRMRHVPGASMHRSSRKTLALIMHHVELTACIRYGEMHTPSTVHLDAHNTRIKSIDSS